MGRAEGVICRDAGLQVIDDKALYGKVLLGVAELAMSRGRHGRENEQPHPVRREGGPPGAGHGRSRKPSENHYGETAGVYKISRTDPCPPTRTPCTACVGQPGEMGAGPIHAALGWGPDRTALAVTN